MAVEFTSNAAKIKRRFTQASKNYIRDATLQLQRESLIRTPVDTAQLRTSQQVVFGSDAQGDYGAVGYTAEHAPYVHEIPDAELSAETRARRAAAGTSSNFLRGPYEELKETFKQGLELELKGVGSGRRSAHRDAAD